MMVMGDVTGKGPTAAATTSLARYTMRTAASYEDDPRAIVARLNATLAEDPERRQICTAVCVQSAAVTGADPGPGSSARSSGAAHGTANRARPLSILRTRAETIGAWDSALTAASAISSGLLPVGKTGPIAT